MTQHEYEKQVSFRDDGIYVGGVKLPGIWSQDFVVRESMVMEDDWEVVLTLNTGVTPTFDLTHASVDRVDEHEARSYRFRSAESGGVES